MSWKVRSAARKSGSASPASTETTPTSVTFGKSWPLAIICVPTSMSSSPAAKREDGLLVDRAARGRVAVEPRDAQGGEALLQNLLDLLGALADEVA